MTTLFPAGIFFKPPLKVHAILARIAFPLNGYSVDLFIEMKSFH